VEMVEQVHQTFMHMDHQIQFFMLEVVEVVLEFLQETTLQAPVDLEEGEMVVDHLPLLHLELIPREVEEEEDWEVQVHLLGLEEMEVPVS